METSDKEPPTGEERTSGATGRCTFLRAPYPSMAQGSFLCPPLTGWIAGTLAITSRGSATAKVRTAGQTAKLTPATTRTTSGPVKVSTRGQMAVNILVSPLLISCTHARSPDARGHMCMSGVFCFDRRRTCPQCRFTGGLLAPRCV